MEALQSFSSCDVSDALVKLGVNDCHLLNVKLLSGSKIVGPAYTVQFGLKDSNYKPMAKHHVDSAPVNSIIVIQSPSGAPNAVWGGLMTAGARNRHVLGVIVEGRVRDLSEMNGFPVYATGLSTLGASPYSVVQSIGEPVTFAAESKWPVTIKSGDIIVADENGVVRVPFPLLDQVVQTCSELTAIDALCMKDIQSGRLIAETFQEHRSKPKK